MDEKDNSNVNGDIDSQLPILRVESSGVSVTAATSPDEEQEFYYPDEVASTTIVADSTAVLGVQLEPEEQQQMVEAVDYAKTHKPYLSELEISLNIKEGFKIKIKRQPKKVIRYFKKK